MNPVMIFSLFRGQAFQSFIISCLAFLNRETHDRPPPLTNSRESLILKTDENKTSSRFLSDIFHPRYCIF